MPATRSGESIGKKRNKLKIINDIEHVPFAERLAVAESLVRERRILQEAEIESLSKLLKSINIYAKEQSLGNKISRLALELLRRGKMTFSTDLTKRLISSLMALNLHDKAVQIFEATQDANVPLEKSLALLHYLSLRKNIVAAEKIYSIIASKLEGYQLYSNAFFHFLSMVAERGSVDLAKELIEKANMDTFKKNGLHPAIINAMLRLAARVNDINMGQTIIESIDQRYLEEEGSTGAVSFHILRFYVKTGQFASAGKYFRFLHYVSQRGLGTHYYNQMLKSISQAYGIQRGWEALQFLRLITTIRRKRRYKVSAEKRRPPLYPNISSYHTLIYEAANMGDMEATFRLLGEVQRFEQFRHGQTSLFNAVLKVLAQREGVQQAAKILFDNCRGPSPAFIPDIYTYKTIFDEVTRNNVEKLSPEDLRLLLHVWKMMIGQGIRADSMTSFYLLRAMHRIVETSGTKGVGLLMPWVYRHMRKYDLLLVSGYTIAFKCFVVLKKDPLVVLKHMKDANVEPDVRFWKETTGYVKARKEWKIYRSLIRQISHGNR